MKHLFIINPVAGKGNASKFIDKIERYFEDKEDTYVIELTKKQGHATTITMEYVKNGDWRVYSIGGDGTLNEVLNGLAGSNSSIGVIPAGSGNDYFRSLDTKNDERLLTRTIEGSIKKCSMGKVNKRYFLNVASVGIDAEVVYNSRRFKKLPFLNGQGAYILGIFYTVFRYRSFKSKITFNNQTHHKRTLLLAVANGRYYGGGMKIAPLADIYSKDFEIYHIDEAKPLRIIKLFPTLIRGAHGTLREVQNYQSDKVSLSSKEGFMLNVDGEIERVSKADFSLIHNGVNIIVPD
jgi:YegS/Rv2252/BmrU family lipid kinase